jgi:hypothetical protein
VDSQQPEALLYPEHDAQSLGKDYINHVFAMTREKLHDKSDIAIQLAWRDAELRRLHQSEREGWRYADELEQERKRLHEVNQELLEALKFVAEHNLSGADLSACGYMAHGFVHSCRTAIARAEGRA